MTPADGDRPDEVIATFAVRQVVILLELAILVRDRSPSPLHIVNVQALELELIQSLLFDLRERS